MAMAIFLWFCHLFFFYKYFVLFSVILQFAKDSGKYVEEKKLRVILMSPPQSPVLLPRNGELKQDSSPETSLQKDRALSGVENIPPGDGVRDIC